MRYENEALLRLAVTERATTNIQIDVTRVASQVVVGIGFLGAAQDRS